MIIINVCQIVVSKIDILALLDISIFIPDIPVISIFIQSIIIHLNMQQRVLIVTFSFDMGLDK